MLAAFSRRIVGWAMAAHLRTELALAGLAMALSNRRTPPGVTHHSDQGCQYTALAFGQRCRQAGVVPSMGSVGDCYDSAITERFFATLACALLAQRRFPTRAAGLAIARSSRASLLHIAVTPRWATARRPPTNGGAVARAA